MSDIVLHPLTALNEAPAYTADDYRHVVNPFLFPSDGSAFGGVQGVRCGSPSPLATIEGLTVTVKPHCGTVRPWNETGSYTFAVSEPVKGNVPGSLGGFKIVVVVYDPSLSHGETPGAWLQSWDASIPDAKINGLVIARVTAGVVSDVVPKIHVDGTIEVATWNQLIAIWTVNGVEAVTTSNGQRYRRVNDAWVSLTDVQLNPGQWAKDWSVWYKCSMSGNIVSLMVKAARGPEWNANAWERSQILTFPDYVKPNVNDFNVPAAGIVNSGFQLNSTGLYVRPFADVTYAKGAWTSATMTWSV